MNPRLLLIAFAAISIATISPAQARHRHHHAPVRHHLQHIATTSEISCFAENGHYTVCGEPQGSPLARYSASRHIEVAVDSGADPRPSAWCAWWLRRHLSIPKSAFPPYAYNQARAFARIGSPAPRGCTGCIAVFSRGRGGHVGLVESWDSTGNPIILSGNFNGRVATAAHPASRLIALRWPT